jgi:hypothetical protein
MQLGDVGWIHLAQDRGRWRNVVNLVANFRFLKKAGKSWLVVRLLASQQTLCPMALVLFN